MKNFDAAIFDMDGTIADSLYVWKKVDIDFFGKRGKTLPENYGKAVGSMSFAEAASFTKQKYNILETVEDIMNEWYSMAVEEYSFHVKLKPNVKKYIEYIKEKNIKAALCTASPKELYEPFLKNNGIFELFDAFVSGSEVERGKEFPDIYFLTAKKLGVRPERCIVFEDILKGIVGAKAAGMTVFGVYDSTAEEEKKRIIETADGYIYDFGEMLESSRILRK